MKLIVGLGNPGKKFAKTRHNTGYLVVDALASQIQGLSASWRTKNQNWKEDKSLESKICNLRFTDYNLLLAKPQTFMNQSGRAVKKLVGHFRVRPSALLVVHDDLDLELGTWKLQFAKGPKDHKGVLSVEDALGTKDFWRLRVGVENRREGRGKREEGEDYVLENLTPEEASALKKLISTKLIPEIKRWISPTEKGPDRD